MVRWFAQAGPAGEIWSQGEMQDRWRQRPLGRVPPLLHLQTRCQWLMTVTGSWANGSTEWELSDSLSQMPSAVASSGWKRPRNRPSSLLESGPLRGTSGLESDWDCGDWREQDPKTRDDWEELATPLPPSEILFLFEKSDTGFPRKTSRISVADSCSFFHSVSPSPSHPVLATVSLSLCQLACLSHPVIIPFFRCPNKAFPWPPTVPVVVPKTILAWSQLFQGYSKK